MSTPVWYILIDQDQYKKKRPNGQLSKVVLAGGDDLDTFKKLVVDERRDDLDGATAARLKVYKCSNTTYKVEQGSDKDIENEVNRFFADEHTPLMPRAPLQAPTKEETLLVLKPGM